MIKSKIKHYINLELRKKFYQSTSKEYVQTLINNNNFWNSDILEIHNRPNYVKYIKKEFKNKIILYFHNDPLTMSGSKSKNDRLYLLNSIDKIIFNSNWSKNRFFSDLPNKKLLSQKTSVCFQSAPSTKIDFSKKKKIISFVGKLNTAKG